MALDYAERSQFGKMDSTPRSKLKRYAVWLGNTSATYRSVSHVMISLARADIPTFDRMVSQPEHPRRPNILQRL
jgi:hypothetical protein